MAVLKSDDVNALSSFELSAGDKDFGHPGQEWQRVIIKLTSANRLICEAKSPDYDCMLCRSPQDEVAKLLDLLKEVYGQQRQKFNFEPQEPCFEFSIERLAKDSLKVEVWLDAGKAEAGIYTWDALGIRFHTTEDNLVSFIVELEQELP